MPHNAQQARCLAPQSLIRLHCQRHELLARAVVPNVLKVVVLGYRALLGRVADLLERVTHIARHAGMSHHRVEHEGAPVWHDVHMLKVSLRFAPAKVPWYTIASSARQAVVPRLHTSCAARMKGRQAKSSYDQTTMMHNGTLHCHQ